MALNRVDHDHSGVVRDYVEVVTRITGIRQHIRQGFFMHRAYQNEVPVNLTKEDKIRLKRVVRGLSQRELRLARMLHIA